VAAEVINQHRKPPVIDVDNVRGVLSKAGAYVQIAMRVHV
jgi:hypothetical protein